LSGIASIKASSAEFVGECRLKKLSKCMIDAYRQHISLGVVRGYSKSAWVTGVPEKIVTPSREIYNRTWRKTGGRGILPGWRRGATLQRDTFQDEEERT
jgi:hypothetical protein